MKKIVDYLWVVPKTENLYLDRFKMSRLGDFEEGEDKFTFLDLSQNFRNSREIVKVVKSYAEETRYFYEKGIRCLLKTFRQDVNLPWCDEGSTKTNQRWNFSHD